MSKIKRIEALEILDSRGCPTIEVTVTTEKAAGTAKVPSGASKGKHEALELRDGGKRFGGKGVNLALSNIKHTIFPRIKRLPVDNQAQIDQIMLDLDGTKNKKKLGANAILAVSLACAAASASEQKLELFQCLSRLTKRKPSLPQAYFNLINGGKHADNSLSFQEFMVVPQLKKFSDNLRAASEVYHQLKFILLKKYGAGSTTVGDEGGFAPVMVNKNEQALSLLVEAIGQAGYKNRVKLALDAAASGLYHQGRSSPGRYKVDNLFLNKDQLLDYYL